MRWLLLMLLLAGTACNPDDPYDRFVRNVAPILERRCSTAQCHGVAPGTVSLRTFHFATDSYGRLSTPELLRSAHQSTVAIINTKEAPELSSLLRKPLPPLLGGQAHAGGALFRDLQDPVVQTIRQWIVSEPRGGEDEHPAQLTPNEQFFANEVQPRLRSAQCMLAPCHGSEAGFPLRFDGGVAGAFGVRATRENYRAAIVHLSLNGTPEQSRLLKKVLRSPAQSIAHRGGNGVAAFPADLQDPLARAIVQWARLERSQRIPEDAPLSGVLFIGGSVRAARINEHNAFVPGSDLFLLSPAVPTGTVRNLTATLHNTPVEIRHPALNDAATHVAFSFRAAENTGTELWEMELASGRARRRTTFTRLRDGTPSHDLWPAYASDGRLWFVSTRAGMLAEHADGYDTDLYVVNNDGSIERKTHTPSPELSTTFFRTGNETAGSVAFTALRQLGEGFRGVVYRFPEDLHSEYHQHFGITLADDVTFHLREMPDGNSIAVLLDRDAVWSAGALVLIDRNQGPELSTEEMTRVSLPGFVHAASFLGPYGSHSERGNVRRTTSQGAYRDPSPLPDGRVLVSFAPDNVSLRDRTTTPNFSLRVLDIARTNTSPESSITRNEVLFDQPNSYETEPIGIYRAATPRIVPPAPTGTTGVLLHGGVPLLEQLLGQVGPAGERVPLSSIRYVRVLEWIASDNDPRTRENIATLHPEQRRSGATPHTPARVLGEVSVEADGSFALELPAGTAFRLQFLDAEHLSTGTQHNRWFDLNGGQTLRQGIGLRGYAQHCPHCHGALSGTPSDTFTALPLAAVSSASHTLARYYEQDPTRPRSPTRFAPHTAQSYSYRTALRPLLQRSCASNDCHSDRVRAGNLSLSNTPTSNYDVAYEALVTRGNNSADGFRYVAVTATSARRSWLWEVLQGREFDAPGHPLASGPHTGVPPLTEDERSIVLRWIETGALFCTEDCP